MAGAQRMLRPGEEMVLDLRPHWSFMTGPVIADLVAVVTAVVVDLYLPMGWSWVEYVFVLAVVALTLWLAARYARWTTTRFMVTTDRVVSRTGALSRRGREIPLERINDIAFSQSLVERLLGTGSLILESGGERGQQTFADIARPGQVQNEIYTQIERVRLVQGGRQAGGQPLSVVEQLEKLDELRNRGVLTDAEFEAQKASLFRAT